MTGPPSKIIAKILEVYRPTAVVLQCGADSLAGDRLGCFNITMEGHAHCVQFLRKYDIPLILLGGGGYTVKNVVRAWAYETACALGIENDIDPNLPWNQYFEWFGPRYRLEVVGNNMEDLNVVDGILDRVRFVSYFNPDYSRTQKDFHTGRLPCSNYNNYLEHLLSACTMFPDRE